MRLGLQKSHIFKYLLTGVVILLCLLQSAIAKETPLIEIDFQKQISDITRTNISDVACDVPISTEGGFTKQEVWAWNTRLCTGNAVDMSFYPNSGKNNKSKCELSNRNKWPRTRRLTGDFISFLQRNKDRFKSIGIVISCAEFDDEVSFYNLLGVKGLILNKTFFKSNLLITDEKTSMYIKILKSVFLKNIVVSRASISELVIKDTMIIGKTKLSGITTDYLSIIGSMFGEGLTAQEIKIKNTLFIIKSHFQKFKFDQDNLDQIFIDEVSSNVIFYKAEIGEKVNIENTKFYGDVSFDGAVVKGDFFCIDCRSKKYFSLVSSNVGKALDLTQSEFNDVSLNSSSVRGVAILDMVSVTGELSLNSTRIDSSLFFRDKKKSNKILNNVDFTFLNVDGNIEFNNKIIKGDFSASSMVVANNLYIQNSKVNNLDLYGSRIESDLSVSSSYFSGALSAKNISISGSVVFTNNSNFIGGVFFQNGVIERSIEVANSKFSSLKFINSNIGKSVLITNSTIAESLSFNSSSISFSLLIRDFAYPISESGNVKIIGDLDLIGANVEGNIEIQNKRISNSINAERLRLRGSLFINTKDTELRNIVGSLNLRGLE